METIQNYFADVLIGGAILLVVLAIWTTCTILLDKSYDRLASFWSKVRGNKNADRRS